jgi:PilZ domain
MEHRWGERFAVSMTVELSSGSSPPVTGSLENVSASGAFVRMDQRGPPRGPVAVILRQDGSGRTRSVRLAAYVVRETEGGVGIEWCRFAPRAIREIMLHGADGAEARKARSARRPLQESDTGMPPRAQPPAAPAAIRTRTQ